MHLMARFFTRQEDWQSLSILLANLNHLAQIDPSIGMFHRDSLMVLDKVTRFPTQPGHERATVSATPPMRQSLPPTPLELHAARAMATIRDWLDDAERDSQEEEERAREVKMSMRARRGTKRQRMDLYREMGEERRDILESAKEECGQGLSGTPARQEEGQRLYLHHRSNAATSATTATVQYDNLFSTLKSAGPDWPSSSGGGAESDFSAPEADDSDDSAAGETAVGPEEGNSEASSFHCRADSFHDDEILTRLQMFPLQTVQDTSNSAGLELKADDHSEREGAPPQAKFRWFSWEKNPKGATGIFNREKVMSKGETVFRL